MNVALSARERARRELTAEILTAARHQLAEVGASALSVRAVARELGLVSSAVYRYFATRDELLTELIVEAYDSVADAVERAGAADGRSPRTRFVAASTALRDWSREHPHEYALLYGSPVPGYQGDQRTTTAGSRLPQALLGIVVDAQDASDGRSGGRGLLRGRSAPAAPRALDPRLAAEAAQVAGRLGRRVAPEVLVSAVQAWTALFGLVSFELFGQLANTFEPADALFAQTVEDLADRLGL